MDAIIIILGIVLFFIAFVKFIKWLSRSTEEQFEEIAKKEIKKLEKNIQRTDWCQEYAMCFVDALSEGGELYSWMDENRRDRSLMLSCNMQGVLVLQTECGHTLVETKDEVLIVSDEAELSEIINPKFKMLTEREQLTVFRRFLMYKIKEFCPNITATTWGDDDVGMIIYFPENKLLGELCKK